VGPPPSLGLGCFFFFSSAKTTENKKTGKNKRKENLMGQARECEKGGQIYWHA